MHNDVTKYENILPQDFNGTFEFTNWSDEDFIGRWGSNDYHFPAKSRSPMIMNNHTPLEIQNIRKKFAKDLGEREFFKSKQYQTAFKQERNSDGTPKFNSIHQGGTYNLDQLAPFIQRCLEPLEIQKAVVSATPKEKMEDKLSRNEEGELNTEAIDKRVSLKEKALKS